MIVERKENTSSAHALLLRDRSFLEVHGVNDVERFDEEMVVLSTLDGRLTVEGSTLHVRTLNLELGSVSVEGRVDALFYDDPVSSDKNEKQGFFGKLFR